MQNVYRATCTCRLTKRSLDADMSNLASSLDAELEAMQQQVVQRILFMCM